LAGPDSYRQLPALIRSAVHAQEQGERVKALAVDLSEYETYLVLVEGIPEEADRIALVQQRVKKLKPQK